MASVSRQQGERNITRKQPRPRRARRGLRWWEWLQLLFGSLVALVLLGATGAVLYTAQLLQETTDALGSFDALVDYRPGGITEIYATDKDPKTGKLVRLGTVYGQYREFVPIQKIPDQVKFATVAIEDERFYEHSGLDLHGIARAVYNNYKAGKLSEGASTLTQQLARNLILKNNKKTLSRKLQEAILSIQIERNFSKEQILEMYLNEVCYGANAFGVQAAAKVYFNKPVQKLTLSEAALLAGLPQRPTRYEPFKHYDHKKKKWTNTVTLDRRDTVLAKMKEVKGEDSEQGGVIASNLPGIKALSDRDIDAAKKAKPTLAPEPDPSKTRFKAPYFTNYVLKQLVQKFGAHKVYNGGLKVYTTLNYQMQVEAERALINGVIQARSGGVTEGALISVEPRSGYIRAMVGGVDYNRNEYNNAIQGKRQPGSSFKAFVYTAAFASGKFRPESYISDSPVRYGTWAPKNYGGGYHGTVSLRQAFIHSYNIPAVKLADAVGIKAVIETARKMGVDTYRMEQQRNLALALGAGEVSPLEMASAYSTYPNRGNYAHPMSIIRVVDAEGNELPGFEPVVDKQVIPESVVAQVSALMAEVVERGTAASAKGIHDVPGARGKTGTTNDNKDAWFVGYTPELSTAVWVCGVRRYQQGNKVVVKYPPMSGVTGGRACAPIWARFMKAAVPIQQQYEKTNRKLPEQVIPSTARLLAGAAPPASSATPTPGASAARSVSGEAVTATAEEPAPLTIPRSGEGGPKKGVLDLETGVIADAAPAAPTTGPTPEPETPAEPTGPSTETPPSLAGVLRPAAGSVSPARSSGGAIGAVTPTRVSTAPLAETVVRTTTLRPNQAGQPQAARLPQKANVCSGSGMLATRWCPVSFDKTFPNSSKVPTRRCTLHKPMPGDG